MKVELLLAVLTISMSVHAAHAEVSPWQASIYSAKSALYRCNLPEAEKAYEKAIGEAEKLGPKDRHIGESLSGLAGVYRLEGKYSEAEALLKRALSIDETAFGSNSVYVIADMNNLARLYIRQKKYAEALDLLNHACELSKDKGGGEPGRSILVNIARLADEYAVAKPLFEKSWEESKRGKIYLHPAEVLTAELNAKTCAERVFRGHVEDSDERDLAYAKEEGKTREGNLRSSVYPEVDFGSFMTDLPKRLRATWSPPKGYEQARVTVKFRILDTGEIDDLGVVNSSGIVGADLAALAAVREAAPFPGLTQEVSIKTTFPPK
jgi:TonB family protein